MASNKTIDHHKPIGYVSAGVLCNTPFTVTEMRDERKLIVSGTCPTCGGLTVTEVPYGLGGIGSKGLPSQKNHPGNPERVTIICECGHVHPDRPPDAIMRGCGRAWTIELPVSQA